MKIHSVALQFKYSQMSLLKAIFDELFASPELFVEFSIWKPDLWNRVDIAQAGVIKAHSDLAESECLDLCSWHTHYFHIKQHFCMWCVVIWWIMCLMWNIFSKILFLNTDRLRNYMFSLLYWVTAFCTFWVNIQEMKC